MTFQEKAGGLQGSQLLAWAWQVCPSLPPSFPPSVTESSFQATLGCLIFGRETWVNELLGSTCAADPQMTASCR